MALRDFGGIQLNKEECRRTHGVQLWDDLGADFRYAICSLIREPGFAAVTILTLGLGIGATMTIFSAIDAVLLRPLAYPAQDRLVELRQQSVSNAVGTRRCRARQLRGFAARAVSDR